MGRFRLFVVLNSLPSYPIPKEIIPRLLGILVNLQAHTDFLAMPGMHKRSEKNRSLTQWFKAGWHLNFGGEGFRDLGFRVSDLGLRDYG